MAKSNQELLEEAESLKNILAAKATDERANEFRFAMISGFSTSRF
jgi:hypothetical protein